MDLANAATVEGSILKVICNIARAFDIPADTSDSSQANLSRRSHRGCKTELSRSSFPASRPVLFNGNMGQSPPSRKRAVSLNTGRTASLGLPDDLPAD
jgi:hypothetical protein